MDDSLKRNEKDIQTEEKGREHSESESFQNENSSQEAQENDLSVLQRNIESSEQENVSSISIDEAIRDLPEVMRFIQRLQECILHQRALIHKLYHKLKEGGIHKSTTKDASTQTREADFEVWAEPTETGNLVEDIKKAAENAVQQTGFVYEATSGMYYDYNTGYYYNAELGLYYEGNSGTYYYFDESSKSFQFHSQVGTPSVPSVQPNVLSDPEDDVRKKRQNVGVPEFCEKMPKKIKIEAKEEGECSESGSESDNEITPVSQPNESVPSNDLSKNHIELNIDKPKTDVYQNIPSDSEIASAWPPCLRVVVKETTLDNLVVGSLFIVTCTGGTLGREGDHAIFIPDISISKHHARVSFSEQEQCYQLVDLGSRNGTFVDGRRVSVALRESDPVTLQHGTQVRVGATTLECHLHPGRETCRECEPGCAIRSGTGEWNVPPSYYTFNRFIPGKQEVELETREARHRSELRRLRKRFGLDKLTVKEKEGLLAPGYQDRAEERRKTVGSQDHHVKTETASVHESIQSNNKGFKMLAKMGWSKGQALGKDSTKGITEPVLVEQRPEKAGLGSDVVLLPTSDPKAKKKTELWKKAQKRFQELDDGDD